MPFFGTITERDFRKKNPQHRNIYKLIQCCTLDFFPLNTLGDGSAFWIFFQDSRIRVKCEIKMETRIGYLSSQNIELERANDILSKENNQFMKSIEQYEQEMDKILREKEQIKTELDQTLQALNEM